MIRAFRCRQCSVTFLGEAIGGVNSSLRLTSRRRVKGGGLDLHAIRVPMDGVL